MARIAFIGLGNMGGPMARNLLGARHEVLGHDVSGEALRRFEGAGGRACGSAGEAAAGAEAVVTMLPAGEHVRAVYLGPEGLFAAARPGTLFVDCSTIDVATARQVEAGAEETGHLMVDAPVSGGVAGAEAATLTFMVGGAADAFARAEPILQAMGRTIIHAGPSGSGQAAKICNNMMLAASMIGVCEGFALAEKLGLDEQKLFDISSKSSGQCWSLTSYCPVPGPVPNSPANRDYAPGFTAAMMLKDLRLAEAAAASVGAAVPLGAEAAQIYGLFVNAGNAGVDFSGVIRMLRGA